MRENAKLNLEIRYYLIRIFPLLKIDLKQIVVRNRRAVLYNRGRLCHVRSNLMRREVNSFLINASPHRPALEIRWEAQSSPTEPTSGISWACGSGLYSWQLLTLTAGGAVSHRHSPRRLCARPSFNYWNHCGSWDHLEAGPSSKNWYSSIFHLQLLLLSEKYAKQTARPSPFRWICWFSQSRIIKDL